MGGWNSYTRFWEEAAFVQHRYIDKAIVCRSYVATASCTERFFSSKNRSPVSFCFETGARESRGHAVG